MASVRSPFVTLLQEQIWAPAGSAPTPKATPAVRSNRSYQRERIAWQRFADHGPQNAVRRRIADQNSAQQRLGVVGEHQLGVRLVDGVIDHHLEAARGDGHRIAEAGHVDAEQFELGGHVGLGKLRGTAEQAVRDDLCAGVAGADEAVAPALDRGHFADRIDAAISCGAGEIGEYAAALGDLETGFAGQLVARTHARRKDHHAGFDDGAVTQRHQDRSTLAGLDRGRADADVDVDAQLSDHPAQQRAACLVELLRHQPRGHLDYVGVQSERTQRIGGFESEQAAANDHSGRRMARRECGHRVGADRIEIVERAVALAARSIPVTRTPSRSRTWPSPA
jgi:hypothetical protein